MQASLHLKIPYLQTGLGAIHRPIGSPLGFHNNGANAVVDEISSSYGHRIDADLIPRPPAMTIGKEAKRTSEFGFQARAIRS
jgi:hypothetical protein